MTVRSIMTSNPFTIGADEPVTEAQALMRREHVHRLPVLDKHNRLVGIITEKDLLYASPSPATTLNVYEMSNLLSKLKVSKVMTREVLTTGPSDLIEDAARVMTDHDIGGLPVVDNGTLVGIVSESDIFRLMIDLFGTRRRGVRATLRLPERPGELADLTRKITEAGGNIISLGTFSGNSVTNAVCTLKVENLTGEQLEAVVHPLIQEMIDMREC